MMDCFNRKLRECKVESWQEMGLWPRQACLLYMMLTRVETVASLSMIANHDASQRWGRGLARYGWYSWCPLDWDSRCLKVFGPPLPDMMGIHETKQELGLWPRRAWLISRIPPGIGIMALGYRYPWCLSGVRTMACQAWLRAWCLQDVASGLAMYEIDLWCLAGPGDRSL